MDCKVQHRQGTWSERFYTAELGGERIRNAGHVALMRAQASARHLQDCSGTYRGRCRRKLLKGRAISCKERIVSTIETPWVSCSGEWSWVRRKGFSSFHSQNDHKKNELLSYASVPSEGELLPDESSSADPRKEPPGVLGWVKKKWAENRAEYERLRGILKDLGLAGFLSYGLFNTAYYLASFLFVWFFVAPSPSGLGIVPAAKRFIKIFAMVWAGSQVTKLIRAGGALLLAPVVDRGLDWFTEKGKFRSKAQAFWTIVGSCFALALVVFVIIVSLWA